MSDIERVEAACEFFEAFKDEYRKRLADACVGGNEEKKAKVEDLADVKEKCMKALSRCMSTLME